MEEIKKNFLKLQNEDAELKRKLNKIVEARQSEANMTTFQNETYEEKQYESSKLKEKLPKNMNNLKKI